MDYSGSSIWKPRIASTNSWSGWFGSRNGKGRRAEIRRRREEEQEKVGKLLEDSEAWAKTERIRAYATAVEASAVTKKNSIDAGFGQSVWWDVFMHLYESADGT